MPIEHCLHDLTRTVRIRFIWTDDRFHHCIETKNDERWVPVLNSVEGSAVDDWPSSPPLQELHAQPIADDQDCIFGVGKAGSAHWSLSVDAPEPQRFRFDVAARIGGPNSSLGSEYVLSEFSQIQAKGEATVVQCGRFRLSVGCGDLQNITVLADGIRFSPMTNAEDKPTTVRWKYIFDFSRESTP